MVSNSVPTSAQVDAQVGVPSELVELWNGDRNVYVPADQVEGMRALGFERQSSLHLPGLVADAKALISELPKLLDGVMKGVEDGEIDTSDTAAMAGLERGISEVGNALATVLNTIHRSYPVKQGKSVIMHRTIPANESGGEPHEEEIEVDPTQVALYRQDGWSARRNQ